MSKEAEHTSFRWNDDGIIFVIKSLRQTSGAQSLASLMNAFVQLGRKVYLVTQTEPSGDDYISHDDVKRYSLDVYEAMGYSPEDAFFKIISEIPVRTVAFAGDVYAKSISLFQTAQKLSKCTLFISDRSPYAYPRTGSEKLTMDALYMIQNSDCVISMYESDAEAMEKAGAKKSVYLPFYFPYFDKEVGAAELSGRRIVYYTTYAGRNTRTVITAFARLHERYPDASMTIVIYTGVKSSDVLDTLVNDVAASKLSDCLTIETKILKPLRFLREADISLTYSHLLYMPETVMESMSAGIPAINIHDAEYSDEMYPIININAANDVEIEKQLEYFMDESNRKKYSDASRALLGVEYREQLAKKWSGVFTDTLKEYTARLNKKYDEFMSVRQSVKTMLDKKTAPCDIVKALVCEYVPVSYIFGALLVCGVSAANVIDAFKNSDAFAQRDYYKMIQKIDVFGSYDSMPSDALLSSKHIPSDAIVRLAASGVDTDKIPNVIKKAYLDKVQCAVAVADAYAIERGLLDIRIPNTDGVSAETPEVFNMFSSFKTFNLENAPLFKNKKYRSLWLLMRFLNWCAAPYSSHGIFGKILLSPSRLADRAKKAIQRHGLKRLSKRKVTEVAPEDVRKIQLMVLQLMLEFEKICKRHNLRYYLAGGTILGGIRHKGFIPWDDDMDITMPRPDYEKFLKIAQKELPPEYKLDKDCVPFCHNRIEYKDSKFDSYWRDGGIFLDILALDGSPDDEKERRKHEYKTRFWRTIMLEKVKPLPILTSQRDVQKLFIRRLIARFIPRKFLKWRWHSWAAKYSCDNTTSWVCLPASIYTYEQERFPVEYWGEPVMMEFEGRMMPTMSHWEDYLVCHFGNYMKMPPETLRKSHHFIYEYSLGEYKNMTVEQIEEKLKNFDA